MQLSCHVQPAKCLVAIGAPLTSCSPVGAKRSLRGDTH
jgi:hypothetical protein